MENDNIIPEEMKQIKEAINDVNINQINTVKIIVNNHKTYMKNFQKLQEYNKINDMTNAIFEMRISRIEDLLNNIFEKIA